MENNAKILLCDENGEERKRIVDFLSKSGFHNIDEVSNGEAALNRLINGGYDLAIVDLWLSVVDGIGIIRSVQKSSSKNKPSFILMSPINNHNVLLTFHTQNEKLAIYLTEMQGMHLSFLH